jgi:3-keto-5-aminohexanoate cleavage enzyme
MSVRTTTSNVSDRPVVIEAAITPLRTGAAVQPAKEIVAEATSCLAAGAAIVHHHHDFRLERQDAVQQFIDVEMEILAEHPSALLYADYLRGRAIWEKNAHLQPMADAGVLRMVAIDPGLTTFGRLDDQGLPTVSFNAGAKHSEAHEVVEFAKRVGVPMSLGVFEPGQLRWILAYAAGAGFPAGSMIKLYFGGRYLVDQVGVAGLNPGLNPTKAALDIYLSMMEDCGLPWIVSVMGDVLLDTPLARYALERGGHLRVGVEDTAGMTDMTNRETVEAAIALADETGRPTAQGKEAIAAPAGGGSADS